MAIEVNPVVLLFSFAGAILAPTLTVYLLLAYRLEEGLEEVEEEVKQIQRAVEGARPSRLGPEAGRPTEGPGPSTGQGDAVGVEVEMAPAIPQDTDEQASQKVEGDEGDDTVFLVVDDDPLVRQVLARYIESNGFPRERIHTAANAGEALTVYEEHRPDVALLDVDMPGPGGHVIADEFRQVDPDIDIALLTSTDPDDPRVRQTVRKLRTGYVRKPVEPEDLPDPRALTDPPAWADT